MLAFACAPLTGSIPDALLCLSHLYKVSIFHNKISGLIPSRLPSWRLGLANFDMNRFSGLILSVCVEELDCSCQRAWSCEACILDWWCGKDMEDEGVARCAVHMAFLRDQENPWQPETWWDFPHVSPPGNRGIFSGCLGGSLLSDTSWKKKKIHWKNYKNPVEMFPWHSRFLSLVVVKRVLICTFRGKCGTLWRDVHVAQQKRSQTPLLSSTCLEIIGKGFSLIPVGQS